MTLRIRVGAWVRLPSKNLVQVTRLNANEGEAEVRYLDDQGAMQAGSFHVRILLLRMGEVIHA